MLSSGRSDSGATWPWPCLCFQCASVVLRGCRNVGSVTVTSWQNLESTSLCCPSLPSSVVEPNFSLRCRKLPFNADLLFVLCGSCQNSSIHFFIFFYFYQSFQAQVEEFEKRLTAVHTRGLENVESPEMDEENQKGGVPTEKTTGKTPLPARGRLKSRRGQDSQPWFWLSLFK